MKIKQKNPYLKRLPKINIFEERQGTISEPLQSVSPQTTEQPQNISLDQKVDKFLIEYEREASLLGRELTGDIPPTMSESFKRFKLFARFLFEADDPTAAPPTDAGGGADPAADAGAPPDLGAPGGAPGGEGEEKQYLPSPKIDINAFASLLARLIMNIDSLLDPQTTILNRAQAYVAKNYNDTVSRELMSKLELQYGMSTRNTEDKNNEHGSTQIQVGAAADGPSG